MVLPILRPNGGHLGFMDIYESDFDRLFIGHSQYPIGEKTVEKPFIFIFCGFECLFSHIYLSIPYIDVRPHAYRLPTHARSGFVQNHLNIHNITSALCECRAYLPLPAAVGR